MFYKSGYKYQLMEDEFFLVGIFPLEPFDTKFISMQVDGKILVKAGYAWDGPSGPTYDSKNSMRASLLHDALYQLMRQEYIGLEWREQCDKELDRILKLDGMWAFRRWYWMRGVRWFAGGAADPENVKEVYDAP